MNTHELEMYELHDGINNDNELLLVTSDEEIAEAEAAAAKADSLGYKIVDGKIVAPSDDSNTKLEVNSTSKVENIIDNLGYDVTPKFLQDNEALANKYFTEYAADIKNTDMRKQLYKQFKDEINKGVIKNTSSDEFDAEWAKMSFDDRVVLHNKLFPPMKKTDKNYNPAQTYENNYNQLVSYPDLVKTRIHNKLVEGGDRSAVYAGIKDLFSDAGRFLDSGKDALLSPKQVTWDSFTKDVASTSDDSFNDVERSEPGKMISGIIRDPYASASVLATGLPLGISGIATATGGKVKNVGSAVNAGIKSEGALSSLASKIPGVANKTPRVQNLIAKIIPSALGAGTETGIEVALEKKLAGKDRSYGEIPISMGLGAGLSGTSTLLKNKANKEFENLVTRGVRENAPKKFGGQAKYDAYINEITSKPLRKGNFKYDLPLMIKNLSEDIDKLGANKQASYEALETLNKKFENKIPDDVIPLIKSNEFKAKELFDGEFNKLLKQRENNEIGFDEYLAKVKELERTKSDFLTKRDFAMNELKDVTDAKKIKEIVNKTNTTDEIQALKTELANLEKGGPIYSTKSSESIKKQLKKDIANLESDLKDSPSNYYTDFNDLFKIRKAVDNTNKNYAKKLNQGTVDNVKTDIAQSVRTTLNNQMVDQADKLKKVLPLDLTDESHNVYSKAMADLEETKDLPNLYNKQNMIANIGGAGNSDKSAYSLFKSGNIPVVSDVWEFAFPTTGIRQAQLSDLAKDPVIQREMSRYLAPLPLQLFNNNEEK